MKDYRIEISSNSANNIVREEYKWKESFMTLNMTE
jgi:hypothetical protein